MVQTNQAAPTLTRLFLVDDEPLLRRGLRLLIDLQPDLMVCGEAEDCPSALKQIVALKPDLAVVDLHLKLGDGTELIKRVRRCCPATKILVFSMHDEGAYAERAFRAGANGYVVKEEGGAKVIEAIGLLMRGKRYLSEKIATKLKRLP